MQRLRTLISRFRKDERGVFLVIFAILGVVLIASSGAVVDFTKMQQARTRAQTALDAGTLALQGQISTLTNEELRVRAEQILQERLDDDTITAVVDSATKNVTEGKLTVEAHIIVPTAFVQLVGISSITAHLLSEVTRASSDLEVSVSLDVTGSMLGSKISSLRSATNTLIDLVVKDVQTPTYSKMAIVPWSAAVNVGSYASNVRGPVKGPWTVTNVAWANGTAKTVTAITKANPGVVTTSAAHGFVNGDRVIFTGISGMTQVNNNIYTVTLVNSTRFSIGVNTNTSSYTAFTSGGTPRVTKCLNTTCSLVVTMANSPAHEFNNNDQVYFTGVVGMTQLNNNQYTVASRTATSYVLSGTLGTSFSPYTSGGSAHCVIYTVATSYGCSYFYFDDANTGTAYQRFPVTTCVSERVTNPYTDTAPSTTKLNFMYSDGGNPCIAQTIVPLTTNKTTLHALANSLIADGSTAGHLGLAWGWYMIAPNFAYLWPTASQPDAYGRDKLIKAVIFMTDGIFNTPYCNGVIARDALTGSGSASDHIYCNSPNGASKAQAQALCAAIKTPANKTLLYTVGFDLAGDTTTLNFLRDCATSPDYFFQADNGTDLTIAFQSIAGSLSELRLSK